MTTEAKATKAGTFGAGNLLITDGADKVQIEFDPRQIIGKFSSGNPKVCSTGSYRTLDLCGVRVMLHVIGRSS